MLEFLPENVKEGLRHLNLNEVYELRLRQGKPTTVNRKGEYQYLSLYGCTERVTEAIVVTAAEIEATVYAAGKFSVYSVEEQIKRGFITAEHGERLGLAGEFVFDKDKPLTVRNITSLCIRIPHEVVGSGAEIYERCFSDGLKNLLLASPPGQGKTTILRDLTRLICRRTRKNVLVCDERGELSSGDLGAFSDVLLYADKQTAFEAGIRAMRPDIIVTDELFSRDLSAVKRVIDGGVKVLASAHFLNANDMPTEFLLFERYAFLDGEKVGTLKGVYDGDLKEL